MIFKRDKLTVKAYDTTHEMGYNAAQDAARKIKELLSKHDYINIIFAAAPSQSEFLAELVKHDDIEWNRINAFHMDEYIGLSNDAPQRFGNFLKREIFGLVPFKSVNYLDGNKPIEEECERYTELLEKYPPHMVCLGIGENGHIAFNDPAFAFFDDKETVKAVSLDDVCRNQQVHDKCFDKIEEVPMQALTLTIPTLLRGEYMFCVVPFKTKAAATERMLNGDITESCPASILRTKDNAILYLDGDSASLLNMTRSNTH